MLFSSADSVIFEEAYNQAIAYAKDHCKEPCTQYTMDDSFYARFGLTKVHADTMTDIPNTVVATKAETLGIDFSCCKYCGAYCDGFCSRYECSIGSDDSDNIDCFHGDENGYRLPVGYVS